MLCAPVGSEYRHKRSADEENGRCSGNQDDRAGHRLRPATPWLARALPLSSVAHGTVRLSSKDRPTPTRALARGPNRNALTLANLKAVRPPEDARPPRRLQVAVGYRPDRRGRGLLELERRLGLLALGVFKFDPYGAAGGQGGGHFHVAVVVVAFFVQLGLERSLARLDTDPGADR